MPTADAWAVLESFSLDELPKFSRTVLTSSPVVVLPAREGAPLEAGASFRASFVSSTNAAVPVSLVREPSTVSAAGDAAAAPELPESIQLFMRLHKRAVHDMFVKWESQGIASVSLDAFADCVRAIGGTAPTDDELLTTLQCIDPVRGDEMLVGERWRSRMINCKRLWRKLHNCEARASSRYIRESSASGASRRRSRASSGEIGIANRQPTASNGEKVKELLASKLVSPSSFASNGEKVKELLASKLVSNPEPLGGAGASGNTSFMAMVEDRRAKKFLEVR